MLFRNVIRVAAISVVLPFLGGILCPAARGDDKDDKKKEDKKEKSEPWVEIRNDHFIVSSEGGEKTARRVADQFEMVRRVFQVTMPNARLGSGIPIQVLAARNGQSFAKLFPEFPYDKRREAREQPSGMFLEGPEKTYIGLRTNVSGQVPYDEIYKDYARFVLKLSYRNLPPWLEEGYLNVYGSLTFGDKGPRLGRPDPEDLSVLFASPLLPLDLVFHVDRGSAYYTVGEKNTVYFAESRALVHLLLTDPQLSGGKVLERYIARVEEGADPLASAREVFGDLNQLQDKLEKYFKQTASPPVDIAVPGGSDSGGSARTLSTALVAARTGDFLAQRGKVIDAEEKLEEALKLDPSMAEGEQSMGFLQLLGGHLEEADKHFTRSLELNPTDALSYYGRGQVAMSKGGYVGVPVGSVVAFEKTVELNPEFAPAWSNLASIYVLRPDTLQKALTDAQRAASLAPGMARYQLQVASILDRMGRTEEARKTAAQVQASASNPKMADMAGDVLAHLPQPESSAPASSSGKIPEKSSSPETLRIERKTEPDRAQTASPATPVEPSSPSPEAISTPPRVYSMVGTIAEVNCANAPQVLVTLKAQTIVMHLHTGDLGQVGIKSSGSGAPTKDTSCASLRGRSARVSYLLVSGQTWDGEMQTVEFR